MIQVWNKLKYDIILRAGTQENIALCTRHCPPTFLLFYLLLSQGHWVHPYVYNLRASFLWVTLTIFDSSPRNSLWLNPRNLLCIYVCTSRTVGALISASLTSDFWEMVAGEWSVSSSSAVGDCTKSQFRQFIWRKPWVTEGSEAKSSL